MTVKNDDVSRPNRITGIMARGKRNLKKTSDATDVAASSGDAPENRTDDVIVQGIWGLVYLSIGVLLLISTLFFSERQMANGADAHVLGPYLGTSLAIGIFFIFGRITALMFSLAVCYIGIAKLANKPLRLKLLLFIAVLTVELCLMLAVGYMPELGANGLSATVDNIGANFIGLMVISALSPLFGGRVFGPYFIVSLLMAITVIIGLRIKPQAAIALASKLLVAAVSWIKKAFTEVKIGIENSPDIRKASDSDDANPLANNDKPQDDNRLKEKPSPKKENAAALPTAVPPSISENMDTGDKNSDKADDENRELTPEEQAKKRLEEELSEFRKKKNEPIKIITIDNDNIDAQDVESEVDEFEETRSIDISIIESAIDNDEFKVTELKQPVKPYEIPSPDILSDPPPLADMIDKEAIERNRVTLEKTLMNFGVEGKVVSVSPGPVVTRYEIELAPGVKISRVTGLQDDISLAVSGQKIRIQAPIPGKAAVGIELPNPERQFVHFKHILVSDKFKKNKAVIPIVIGSNISGAPYVADIDRMPHLLIAGQTGAGKSVCMNSLICSLLMTKKPEELRLIMIDPKQVEFASYENIPHLLAPVVTESKEAVKALQWGVVEMERRYTLFKEAKVRKIDDFNEKFDDGELIDVLPAENNKQLPYILIIVDELADLMMTAPKDVESLIMRIAQKARAAGIHLILATQRPSVNVITGPIKANLPSRIAFRTVQANDSRTILDQGGAEKLLGKGDMLFLLNGEPDTERLHGAFISDKDVKAIVSTITGQETDVEKIGSFHDVIEDSDDGAGGYGDGDGGGKRDELFNEAATIIVKIGQGSTSLLQRQLEIGFARAGRIMDQLERAGIVGPAKGSKAREVLIKPEDLEDRKIL